MSLEQSKVYCELGKKAHALFIPSGMAEKTVRDYFVYYHNAYALISDSDRVAANKPYILHVIEHCVYSGEFWLRFQLQRFDKIDERSYLANLLFSANRKTLLLDLERVFRVISGAATDIALDGVLEHTVIRHSLWDRRDYLEAGIRLLERAKVDTRRYRVILSDGFYGAEFIRRRAEIDGSEQSA